LFDIELRSIDIDQHQYELILLNIH